ncbi:MAG TPA: DUF4430 domain-containing protein [Gaiellaceae bacterium]|nr:DUF4430 domain-containing protein [Gaiellaceae bacterium]
MTLRRLSTLLLLALGLLAGCGEEASGEGASQLWVTRDRGAEVVLTAHVPAGISAMEALRRQADVETRYGGRFVQSVEGIEGGLTEQRDWFFYVNGYWADRSASDYTLHDGDVLWWDYRAWGEQLRVPIVVGAFPEPFLHGYDGRRRPAVVEGKPSESARTLAKLVRGTLNGRSEGANRLIIVGGSRFRARLSGGPGDPVVFEVGVQAARRLARKPALARFRYEGLP